VPPVDVLAVLTQLRELPVPLGASTAAVTSTAAAGAASLGVSMAEQLIPQRIDGTGSASTGSSSSSPGSSRSGHDSNPTLLLLCGRTLYTIGQVLLQLHQQAEAQPALPADDGVNNETTLPNQPDISDSLTSLPAEVTAVLLNRVTAVAPALQEAAAELAAGGNSSNSSRVAGLQPGGQCEVCCSCSLSCRTP
jgi:hypothetical protein